MEELLKKLPRKVNMVVVKDEDIPISHELVPRYMDELGYSIGQYSQVFRAYSGRKPNSVMAEHPWIISQDNVRVLSEYSTDGGEYSPQRFVEVAREWIKVGGIYIEKYFLIGLGIASDFYIFLHSLEGKCKINSMEVNALGELRKESFDLELRVKISGEKEILDEVISDLESRNIAIPQYEYLKKPKSQT